MEDIVIIIAAAIPAIEIFLGLLPNKWVPHKSYIIRFFNALNDSGEKKP